MKTELKTGWMMGLMVSVMVAGTVSSIVWGSYENYRRSSSVGCLASSYPGFGPIEDWTLRDVATSPRTGRGSPYADATGF